MTQPAVLERVAAARDTKERAGIRAAVVAERLEALGIRAGFEVERGGDRIVFDDEPRFIRDRAGDVIGVDAMVRVFRGGEELRIDPHRICVNPPVMVRTPGTRVVHREIGGVQRRIELPRFDVDPGEAYLQWLEESLRETPNARGWRTRGTVTTVFSSVDAYIESQNATYATARAGTGTSSVSDGWENAYVGQFRNGSSIYFCLEAFLGFDTSSIPDGDAISAAVLGLYGAFDFSTVDFTINVYAHDFGGSFDTADWRDGTWTGSATLLGTFSTAGFSTAGYNSFSENGSNFRSAISKTGNTRLVLISSRQVANTAPSTGSDENVVFFTVEQAGTTNDPKLTITHAAVSPPGRWYRPARYHIRRKGR